MEGLAIFTSCKYSLGTMDMQSADISRLRKKRK